MNGHLGVVQYLIGKGLVDINAQDDDGRTALHCACADGYLDVVKYMVEGDAKMSITDNDGYKPLHHAALFEHDEIVKFLLVQTAMQLLDDEAKQGPQTRRELREYHASQAKENIGSFDIPPPNAGLGLGAEIGLGLMPSMDL